MKGNQIGDLVLADSLSLVSSDENQRCVDLGFPLGTSGGGRMLRLSIAHLAAGGDIRSGPWNFDAIFPDEMPFAEPTAVPTLSALDMETIGSLTAILKWAYADASRTAILIHFDGWQENYGVSQVLVTDDSGAEVSMGYGAGGSGGGDPADYLLTLSISPAYMAERTELKLHLDLQVSSYTFTQPQPLASFHFDLDLPVYQARTATPGTSVIVNGIEMQVVKASVTPSYTELTLCYQKPSHGNSSDWLLGSGTGVTINTNSSILNGFRLLSDPDYGGYTGKGTPPADLPFMDDGRCVQVDFPIGDLAETGPTVITLNVPYLEKSMPEVIPDDQLQPALEKLKAEGIDMTVYTSSSSGGGGGGGWTFNSKPEGMTDEQAYQKFLNALGYIYDGPWVMEITVP